MFQEFEVFRFQGNMHMKVAKLSDLHTGHLYPLGNIPGTRFLWGLSRTQWHSTAGTIMSIKHFYGTTGNRTCDIPSCSQTKLYRHYISFPIHSSPTNHTLNIKQSELFALSLYKPQITNPYVHLPSPTVVILHKQSFPINT
jgi:hypothetical protein